MFDFHAFFLGFWTTIGLLLAGFYIMVCCGDDIRKAVDRFSDTCNNYIDTMSGATAEKIPIGSNIVAEV
jgi:hypothetical protein